MRSSLALVAILACGGCTKRSTNLQVRYGGVVAVAGAAATFISPSLNGDGIGGGMIALGSALAALGGGLVIGSFVALPKVEALEKIETDKRKAWEAQVAKSRHAVELLQQAEASARNDDCATTVKLDKELADLDPGVDGVLRADVAAARCLKAAADAAPAPTPEP